MLVRIWKQRQFIWQGAIRDLKYRHAGTTLGILWHVIIPLAQLVIFAAIFSRIMAARLPVLGSGDFTFAIYLSAGFIPWLGFCETLTRCTQSLTNNRSYLKKLPISEHVFVAQDVLSSFLSTGIALGLMVGFCMVLGHYPRWEWLHIIPVVLLMQMFAFGLGMILGSIDVFCPDIGRLLPVVLNAWIWFAPIVYPSQIVPQSIISILEFNPVYYHIESLHKIMIYNEAVPLNWYLLMCIFALAACVFGDLILRKLRADIRDFL